MDYNSPVPGTPQPRTPFTHSTPPSTPIRLPGPSPFRQNPRLVNPFPNDYPESPNSPRHHRAEYFPAHPKSPRFGLESEKKYRIPRTFKSPRRTLTCLALLGLVVYLLRTVVNLQGGLGKKDFRVVKLLKSLTGSDKEEDGICRFVSPVEAYQRDLARLRGLYPSDPSVPLEDSENQSQPRTFDKQPHYQYHHYSPTGHLLISEGPLATHPIPQLLSLGEKRWEELLSRQSRTLEEAVREYVRRYGRAPPKGFDLWWEYAMAHDLVLPDEYDRINLDLAPFWALPKSEMKKRLREVEDMKETFTLAVQDGLVDIRIKDMSGLNWDGTWYRAMDAASLLKAFARYLPNLNATFSIFDQPQIYLSWARRESLIILGLRGEHTTHLKETDDAHVRLSRSCSPETNFRKNSSFVEGRSLIYDALEASDICQNPYIVPLHGLTIEPHTPVSHPKPHTALLPLFSLAKTSINSDILITPLDQFYDSPGRDYKWEQKSPKLAWRGSPTGISEMTEDLPWRQSHRIRLHHYANNISEVPTTYMVPDVGQPFLGDADFSSTEAEDEEEILHRSQVTNHRKSSPRVGSGGGVGSRSGETSGNSGSSSPTRDGPLIFKNEESRMRDALDFFMDVKLAGKPLQCSEEDGTCEQMAREIQWAPRQRPEQLNKHKFLLDIDGNGWSGRFRRLMSTNSVVIKTGIFTEWFQPHLIPWFMYIPAKIDFSDLFDILAFFRGTPQNPDLGFDETAKALARNGQCFVKRMFRMEDLHAYMMRLFLEYARIAADEGVDMDFEYDAMADPFGDYDDSIGEADLEDEVSVDDQSVRSVEDDMRMGLEGIFDTGSEGVQLELRGLPVEVDPSGEAIPVIS